MTPEEQYLAAQWPKRCGCGRVFVPGPLAPNPVDGARPAATVWSSLPFAYVTGDEFADQEARHCSCGSTLVIYTRIHDLSKE